jgi:hypothetical protein
MNGFEAGRTLLTCHEPAIHHAPVRVRAGKARWLNSVDSASSLLKLFCSAVDMASNSCAGGINGWRGQSPRRKAIALISAGAFLLAAAIVTAAVLGTQLACPSGSRCDQDASGGRNQPDVSQQVATRQPVNPPQTTQVGPRKLCGVTMLS